MYGKFEIILQLLYCITFMLGLSGSSEVCAICSPDFICPGSAGANGIDWVSVLYLPDQGDLSSVLSGQGGEI